MHKMDLVLQGTCNDYTCEIANYYLNLEFVNRIIISCWEHDNVNINNNRVIIVRSIDNEYPGIGNRNRQIKTSQRGLQEVITQFSAKLRSDQKISLDSMRLMYDFYQKNKERELTFHNNPAKPSNRICVAGIFRPFPFHPRDHIFWGNTQDLIDVFNIPYDTTMSIFNDRYDLYVRSEAYIASWYYAKFDNEIYHYISNPNQYLVDNAIFTAEALQKSEILGNKVFKPFPRINFEWPKHGLKNYHYDFTERTLGEYWDD